MPSAWQRRCRGATATCGMDCRWIGWWSSCALTGMRACACLRCKTSPPVAPLLRLDRPAAVGAFGGSQSRPGDLVEPRPVEQDPLEPVTDVELYLLEEANRVLADSVARLGLKDKLRLWELLDGEIAQAEEEVWERDPVVQAEMREARSAYLAGDYATIDEYIARQLDKA